MKRNNITKPLMLICTAALLLTSCYDDLSTGSSIEIPRIVLLNSTGTLRFDYLEEVDYRPELAFRKEGVADVPFRESDYDAYNYVWRLTNTTGTMDTSRTTIAEGSALKTTIIAAPTGGSPLNLALYMKHKETGMQYSFYWDVNVLGQFSAGYLVADTRDEQTSDISLIMSYQHNYDMWTGSSANGWFPLEDRIHRNIYSTTNLAPIEGIVSSLMYSEYMYGGFAEIAAVVKGRSYTRMDLNSMKVMDRNEEVFHVPPVPFNPQMAFSLAYNMFMLTVLINDGQPYTYVSSENDGKYMRLAEDDNPYEIAEGVVVPIQVYTTARSLFFDQKGGKVICLNSATNVVPRRGFEELPEPINVSVFDPRALSNFDCLYAGYFHATSSFHRSAWLLRDKSSGKPYVYELETTGDRSPYNFQVQGLEIFDMSNCTDLANATCYVTTYNYREFFYAVGNKIYVSILTSGVPAPNARVVFETTNPNEVITHMENYLSYGGAYTYWAYADNGGATRTTAKNNQLTIATYNPTTGEGKVYALPRQYAGSGEFAEREFISEWGGFGRITAICQRD